MNKNVQCEKVKLCLNHNTFFHETVSESCIDKFTRILIQKWKQPLTDQFAKEGKDKKVTFTCEFARAGGEAKWSFKGDVSCRK